MPKLDFARSRSGNRRDRDVARRVITELTDRRFPVGSRMSARRKWSVQHKVSRPTVREAVIALQVQGLVEVGTGSGAYVSVLGGKADRAFSPAIARACRTVQVEPGRDPRVTG